MSYARHEMLTTLELAAHYQLNPSTLWHSHCVRGHWMGVKPEKLPNGHLLWPPIAEIERITAENKQATQG